MNSPTTDYVHVSSLISAVDNYGNSCPRIYGGEMCINNWVDVTVSMGYDDEYYFISDIDGDEIPDNKDPDQDGDGIANALDPTPCGDYDVTGPQIENVSVIPSNPSYADPVFVSATITDPSEIDDVILYYSDVSAGDSIQMQYLGENGYGATIPPFASGSEIIFYIKATDLRSNVGYSKYYDYNVASNTAPDTPSNPAPIDGTIGTEDSLLLSWACSDANKDDLVYEVYLEADDSTPDQKIASAVSVTQTYVGPLDAGATYYWQVIAFDGEKHTTGPIWQFSVSPPLLSIIPLSIDLGDVYQNELYDFDILMENWGNGTITYSITEPEDIYAYGSLESLFDSSKEQDFFLSTFALPTGVQQRDIIVSSNGGTCIVSVDFTIIPKEWTILLYMDGDNNLEENAIDDINELEVYGSSESLNILALVDRAPGYDHSNDDWTGTRLYYITKDEGESSETITSLLLSDWGECNMGDPATLSGFLTIADEYFAADNTMLVLWNHGDGWYPDPNSSTYSSPPTYDEVSNQLDGAIGSDITNNNDSLSLNELQSALTGHHYDIIGFDACLMQMFEVSYAVKDFCNYIVASEEKEPADGWAYDEIVSYMELNPNITPGALGAAIVLEYGAYYGQNRINTLSLIDTSYLGELLITINDFCNYYLPTITDEDSSVLLEARLYSHLIGNENVDIREYFSYISTNVEDYQKQTYANAVISAIDNCVLGEWHSDYCTYANGLSLYFPLNGERYRTNDYSTIIFSNVCYWDEYLSALLQCTIEPPEPTSSVAILNHSTNDILSWNYICPLLENDVTPDIIDSQYYTISPEWMNAHSLTIVFTGEDNFVPIFNDNLLSLFSSYLDQGGALVISSQNYLYPYPVVPSFAQTYLHIADWANDCSYNSVQPVDSTTLVSGLDSFIGDVLYYSDYVYPDAVSLPLYETDDSFPIAVMYDGGYKSVFCGFPLECLPPAILNDLFERILYWSGAKTLSAPNNITGASGVGGAISLYWDEISGVTSYSVYCSTSDIKPETPTWNVTESMKSVSISDGLTDGATYYFWISANVASTEGQVSERVQMKCDASPPSNVHLQSPTDGAYYSDIPIAFSWDPCEDAGTGVSHYELLISTSPVFTGIEPIVIAQCGYSYVGTLPYGQYYWKVRAVDYSGNVLQWECPDMEVRTFFMTLPAPSIISPTGGVCLNGAPGLEIPPLFSWQEVVGCEGYHIEVFTDADISDLFHSADIVSSSTCHYDPMGVDFPDDMYYWRAKAVGGTFPDSPYDGLHQFEIDTSPPTAVTLSDIPHGAVSGVGNVSLSWQDVSAPMYEIEVSSSNTINGEGSFETGLVASILCPDCGYYCNDLMEGTYYWHVRAINYIGNAGDWSETWSFTVNTQKCLELVPGWNLVSMPYLCNNPSVSTMIADVSDSIDVLYQWNPEKQYYDIHIPGVYAGFDTFEKGKGYWVHMVESAPVSLPFMGINTGRDPQEMASGWNLVGCHTESPELISSSLGDTLAFVDVIYQWDPVTSSYLLHIPGVYMQFDEFLPRYGYWVHCIQNCLWE